MSEDEVLDALHRLLEVVQHHEPGASGEVLNQRLSAHLGQDASQVPVVIEDVRVHRFVDHDLALEMVATREGADDVIGVAGDMRHHTALADLLQNSYGPTARVGQPDYTLLADSPTTERNCLGYGIRLFRYHGQPVAVLLREGNPRRGQDTCSLEVLCPDAASGRALLREIGELSLQHSVLRGQVITLKQSGYEVSTKGLVFEQRPDVAEQDVILPPGTLDRIKQHVLGMADHADELRARGQHLKRGVLLYGPPGTGKTHTLRHLIGAAHQHTVVLLTGDALHLVTFAAQLARAMQPAMVVLEDVDLIAEGREHGRGGKPLLFEVMDAMDGLGGEADVTFLLTTNRVDVMEHALTQRPGRVDLAAEIPLPDRAGRRRLLRLYSPDGCFSDDLLDQVADQLHGTTASLAKELVRRAVLLATVDAQEPGDEHLRRATDQMMADGEELSRALLGAAGSGRNAYEADGSLDQAD